MLSARRGGKHPQSVRTLDVLTCTDVSLLLGRAMWKSPNPQATDRKTVAKDQPGHIRGRGPSDCKYPSPLFNLLRLVNSDPFSVVDPLRLNVMHCEPTVHSISGVVRRVGWSWILSCFFV